MAGYGGPDDEALRAIIHVEEQIALSRAMLPKGPGSLTCLECGEDIPEARRKAMPGCVHCVECQHLKHDSRPTARQPWAT